MEEKDFSKLWGANGSVATITDDQYQQGWGYIGDNKPTRAQFNAWQQWADEKSYWLYMNKLGIDDTAKAAEKLKASRTIKLTGAVTGQGSFDGSDNVSIHTKMAISEVSLLVDGFEKRPSGVIEQWGTVDFTYMPEEKDYVLTFPIAFPKQCLNLSLTRKAAGETGGSTWNDGGALIISKDRLGARIVLARFSEDPRGTRGYEWRAIGY